MNVSDKELNGLLGFYTGLRKVVVIAGVVVLVAAVVAVVGGAFIAGQHHALPGAVAEKKADNRQPEDRPQRKKSPAPVRHRRIAPPPEPVEEPAVKPEPEKIQRAPVAVAPISKPAPEPVAAPAPVVFVATVGEKHFRAHWKGRRACDGDLFLTDTQLHFECPALLYRGLTFERDAVSAHDDGIRDIASGHKYHFKVNGLDKQGARVLFNRWVRDGMAAELAAR